MKLTGLEIKNYRGIRHASILFPKNKRIICMIGSGDSGKSTILKAIEWALWPTWNLNAADTDFYNYDTSAVIEITVSITELPESLLKDDKYGLYLRSYEKVNLVGNKEGEDDEPEENDLIILSIRLTIDDNLEPKWEVITNRTDPRPIGQKDRRLLSFGVVGFNYEKDFQWGRESVLQQYAEGQSRSVLHDAFKQAMRVAVKNTNLESLDRMIPSIVEIGQQFGVSFNGDIHNKLLMQNGSYSSTVGIFDDKVPFTQRGLGSKRLLSIAMNVNAFDDGTVVLVDEIETGLEPYRISALINQFRSQFEKQGQLIMTTHSRSVICECGVDELCVVDNNDGELNIHKLDSAKDIKGDIQGIIRGEPDAFLCKRIIVCEGKTEIGLLRALDEHFYNKKSKRFAHYGVGMALGGGGGKFFKLARLLRQCGYDCCVLMDSDIQSEEQEALEVKKLGIKVFSWEKGNAIEEQLFKDVSFSCAQKMINYAVEIKGIQSISAQLDNEFGKERKGYKVEKEAIVLCGAEDMLNKAFLHRVGTVAKKKEWFKRIDRGQDIGNIVFSNRGSLEKGSAFMTVIRSILGWVAENEA